MKVWLYKFHAISKVISIADLWKELSKSLFPFLFSSVFSYLVKIYYGGKILKVYNLLEWKLAPFF